MSTKICYITIGPIPISFLISRFWTCLCESLILPSGPGVDADRADPGQPERRPTQRGGGPAHGEAPGLPRHPHRPPLNKLHQPLPGTLYTNK